MTDPVPAPEQQGDDQLEPEMVEWMDALMGPVEQGRCAIQDCPNPIETWMVTEVAPGRPIVYGVCERDMALIHLAEMPK